MANLRHEQKLYPFMLFLDLAAPSNDRNRGKHIWHTVWWSNYTKADSWRPFFLTLVSGTVGVAMVTSVWWYFWVVAENNLSKSLMQWGYRGWKHIICDKRKFVVTVLKLYFQYHWLVTSSVIWLFHVCKMENFLAKFVNLCKLLSVMIIYLNVYFNTYSYTHIYTYKQTACKTKAGLLG